MFETSGNLTTCLAIYPNDADDWTTSSPFDTLLDTGGGLTYVANDNYIGWGAACTDGVVFLTIPNDANTLRTFTYDSSAVTTPADVYNSGVAENARQIALDTAKTPSLAFGCFGQNVRSFSFTGSGSLTYKNQITTGVWAQGVAVDPNYNYLFTCTLLGETIESYPYLDNGTIGANIAKTASEGFRPLSMTIDTAWRILITGNDTAGMKSYLYTVGGVPSLGSSANAFVHSANGVSVAADTNTGFKLAFGVSADGLHVYRYYSDGTFSAALDSDVTIVGEGIDIDTVNKLIYVGADAPGVRVYSYTINGILTLVDTDDESGDYYGQCVNTANNVLFSVCSDNFKSYLVSETTNAYVFSNSIINNYSPFNLLTGRFTDLGKGTNEVNFLEKTNLTQSATPESRGIGGISKLKDLTFSITKGTMTSSDITSLYGRKVSLFYTDTTGVEDPDGANSEIEFKGEIFKGTRDPKGGEVTFTVRGLLNSANPLVGGPIVEASDGSQKMESIVFGDSGEMYLPLIKKEEDGIYTLQFSQGDDFIIRGLYSKGGSEDEPLYNRIETNYTIEDDEIKFDNSEYQNVFLAENMTTSNYSGHIDRVAIAATWEIGLTYLEAYVPPAPGSKHVLAYKKPLVSEGLYSNDIMYQRTEVIDGVNVYFYNCGWEVIFGFFGKGIDDRAGDALTIEGVTGFKPCIFNGAYILIDQRFIGRLKNPIEKEIDALPWVSGSPGAGSNTNWDFWELKDFLAERDDQSIKDFQLIPQEGLVIKVGDEEMLVIYTEKNSGRESYELAPNRPINTYVWIIRGWNGTIITSHSTDDPVIVINGVNQSIIYTMERELQDLTTVTPSYEWNFSNIDGFLSGASDLAVHDTHVYGNDPVGYIGLNFRFPDLSGDFIKATLVGEAKSYFSTFNSFSSPADDYRQCSINIAFNSPVEAPLIRDRRRAFGENQGESYTYKWAVSYYNYVAGSPKIIQGKYKTILQTSWGFDGSFDDDFHAYDQNLRSWVNPGSFESDFTTYEELKEASMYMVFNGSNRWNKRAEFTVSRPVVEVQMKQRLEDADIYAQIIPKSIFAIPKDTYSGIGTNCKIAWHPKGQDDTYDKKDTMMLIDDSIKYLGALTLDGAGDFDTFYQTASGETTTGVLVEGISEPNDMGKIYPSINKSEYLLTPNSLPVWASTLATGYPHNKFDSGRTFLENDSVYIWVDQANNQILSVDKAIASVGNPVTVIQALLNTYYDSVTLDTAAFTTAAALRTDHKMRLLVSSEERLIRIIDQLSTEHGLITFENNVGEMSIVALDPPLTAVRDIDDSELVFNKKIPDYKEVFTDLDYLITELDVYYDYISNNYNGYIASDDLNDQDALTQASTYFSNEIKIKLMLKTAFDITTANSCAAIKMLYHRMPTRIVKVGTTMSTADIVVGQWVTCSSSSIPEVTNKIYLVIRISGQSVFPGKNYTRHLDCFEYDLETLESTIKFVYDQDVNDDYQFVYDDVDDIQFVYDI